MFEYFWCTRFGNGPLFWYILVNFFFCGPSSAMFLKNIPLSQQRMNLPANFPRESSPRLDSQPSNDASNPLTSGGVKEKTRGPRPRLSGKGGQDMSMNVVYIVGYLYNIFLHIIWTVYPTNPQSKPKDIFGKIRGSKYLLVSSLDSFLFNRWCLAFHVCSFSVCTWNTWMDTGIPGWKNSCRSWMKFG